VRAAIGVIVAAKLLLDAWLLSRGFTHVSDDDYSRTVIAQAFAHAPKLDPSGTSWLPFPFWVNGTAMMAFGRSLETARGVAIVLGVAAPLLVYAALRARQVQYAAILALAPFVAPWLAWLSVATVPEALTSALASAGVIALFDARSLDKRDLAFAACLACACLSRYEAWPMAAAAIVGVATRAWRFGGARNAPLAIGAVALLALGPLAWMAWNAHAHGDALHFLARVSRFRQNVGQADGSTFDKTLLYFGSLTDETKEAVLVIGLAIWGLVFVGATFRARWGGSLSACLATMAFLTYGAMRDGAPTHHPGRAVIIVFPILFAAGMDAARALWEKHVRAWPNGTRGAIAMLAVFVAATAPAWALDQRPGDAPAESRVAQIDRGRALRAQNAQHVRVVPCAYEHFALIAAFGAPERVTVIEPDHRTEPDPSCPQVDLASGAATDQRE
jgi:hypothetical protein